MSPADRDHAPVSDFTFHMLELDGRMVDTELNVQALPDFPQDAFTDRGGDVCDCNMAGKSVAFGTYAPYVEIVHVVHSLNFADRGFDLRQLHSPWSAFQQNVQGFPNDAETGPEDQNADPE